MAKDSLTFPLDSSLGTWHNDFFYKFFSKPEEVMSLIILSLKPKQMEQFDWDTMTVETHILCDNEKLRNRFSDVLVKVRLKNGKKAIIAIVMEHERNHMFEMLPMLNEHLKTYSKGASVVVPIVIKI